MGTQNQFNRAYVKSIPLKIDPSNNGVLNAVTGRLPHGSAIVSVVPISIEAFNGTGTVTLTVTDGTTSFVTAQNVKDAVGIETAAATAKAYTAGGTIKAYVTDQNSDSALGEAWVLVNYVEINGNNENYG